MNVVDTSVCTHRSTNRTVAGEQGGVVGVGIPIGVARAFGSRGGIRNADPTSRRLLFELRPITL